MRCINVPRPEVFITPLRALLLLLAFGAMGCGGPTEPRPDLTGEWFGGLPLSTRPLPVPVAWILADLNPSVTGTGTHDFGSLSFSFDITGYHQEPNVNLTMTANFGGGGTYEGKTQGADSIIGIYTDVLGDSWSITMVRQ